MKKLSLIWLPATALLATLSRAEAQQSGKVSRIGFLSGTSPPTRDDAIRHGLLGPRLAQSMS